MHLLHRADLPGLQRGLHPQDVSLWRILGFKDWRLHDILLLLAAENEQHLLQQAAKLPEARSSFGLLGVRDWLQVPEGRLCPGQKPPDPTLKLILEKL